MLGTIHQPSANLLVLNFIKFNLGEDAQTKIAQARGCAAALYSQCRTCTPDFLCSLVKHTSELHSSEKVLQHGEGLVWRSLRHL